MVMAAIAPQLPQVGIGFTSKIAAGMSFPCWMVTLIPASEVGQLPAPANTGCVSVLPTPAAKTVMTCPGATLSGAGNKYPAPIMVPGLALWPSAESAVAAAASRYRVTERIIENILRN